MRMPIVTRLEANKLPDHSPRTPFAGYVGFSVAILALTVYYSDLLGQFLLVVAVVVGLAFRRLSLVSAVGLTLPYMSVLSLGISVNFSVVDLLIPVLFIAAAFHCWRNVYLTRALAAPIAYSLLFLIWSSFSFLSLPLTSGASANNFSFLMAAGKLGLCFLLFACVGVMVLRDFVTGRVDLLNSWAATAIGTAIVATLELLTQGPGELRFSGGFDNPNLLGLYLITSLGIVVMRRVLLNKNPVGIETLPIILGVLSTGSRGSLLAAAIFVAFVPVLSSVKGKVLGTLVGAVGVFVSAYLVMLQSDSIFVFRRVLAPGGTLSGDDRGTLWDLAIDLWHNSPIAGIGLGQFSELSQEYTGSPFKYNAHNTYLSLLAESGAVGAVLFFSIFVAVFSRLVIVFPVSPRLAVVAALWLPVLVNMATLNGENVRYVWVFLGVCHAASFMDLRSKLPTHENSTDRSALYGVPFVGRSNLRRSDR